MFYEETTNESKTDYFHHDEKVDELYPYIHHISDNIFESSSIHHQSGTFISPLVNALNNFDIKSVNILRRHPAFCHFSVLKNNDLKPLFLDESNENYDWKNIYCTFFYILLKRDENFFTNPDLKDFLSCSLNGFRISAFVRFAKLFLDSERSNPYPNNLSQDFRRTAICTKTLLIR